MRGVIDEEFGFRPDKVEERAHLYALCKIAQETVVRVFDEASDKVYGVIRIGTVLVGGMPEETAASIFIRKGLEGKPLTPFSHSMYRPMLYVDVGDVCRAFEACVRRILNGEMGKAGVSNVVNLYWPEVEVVDRGEPVLFTPEDKELIKIDISGVRDFLGLEGLTDPRDSIDRLVGERLE